LVFLCESGDQAEVRANYIQARHTADSSENILSIGDYNAFLSMMATCMGSRCEHPPRLSPVAAEAKRAVTFHNATRNRYL
jgi:hypothetical protein